MLNPAPYSDGTAVFTAGSTTVTGLGTAWSTRATRGSLIQRVSDGAFAIVASDTRGRDAEPAGDLELELMAEWPGTTTADAQAGDGYILLVMRDGGSFAAAFEELIDRLIGKGLGAFASGEPVAASYRENDVVYTTGNAAFQKRNGVMVRVSPLVRELLTADRTYYVNPSTGSDTNDGLTTGTALATIQKALSVASATDLGGFGVTIQLADGDYTAQFGGATIDLPALVGGNGIIQGNATTWANVICGQWNAAGLPCVWTIQRQKLTAASGYMLNSTSNLLRFGEIDFGAGTTGHINANSGVIECIGPYKVTSGVNNHIVATMGGTYRCNSQTVTLEGTPSFNNFIVATRAGFAEVRSSTFNGFATGRRYNVSYTSVIYTSGAGANYFPGDTAGSESTETSGHYA